MFTAPLVANGLLGNGQVTDVVGCAHVHDLTYIRAVPFLHRTNSALEKETRFAFPTRYYEYPLPR
jgi:hypothetical protein